jgi:hypothetical protein
MFAGVTITSAPANAGSFISIAWQAMDDGDYVTAYALFDCALRRAPLSLEAIAGRLLARSFLEDGPTALMAYGTR